MLALVLVVLVSSLAVGRPRYLPVIGLAACAIIGIAAITVLGVDIPLLTRLQESKGSLETITSYRNVIWGALFRDYTKSWSSIVLGYGLGTTEFLGIHADAHNFYLRVLVETGLVGMFSFIVIIARYVKVLAGYARDGMRDFWRTVMQAIGVILLGWVFSSFAGVLDFVALLIGLGVGYFVVVGDEEEVKETTAAAQSGTISVAKNVRRLSVPSSR